MSHQAATVEHREKAPAVCSCQMPRVQPGFGAGLDSGGSGLRSDLWPQTYLSLSSDSSLGGQPWPCPLPFLIHLSHSMYMYQTSQHPLSLGPHTYTLSRLPELALGSFCTGAVACTRSALSSSMFSESPTWPLSSKPWTQDCSLSLSPQPPVLSLSPRPASSLLSGFSHSILWMPAESSSRSAALTTAFPSSRILGGS